MKPYLEGCQARQAIHSKQAASNKANRSQLLSNMLRDHKVSLKVLQAFLHTLQCKRGAPSRQYEKELVLVHLWGLKSGLL
jgi:hypothetical protein